MNLIPLAAGVAAVVLCAGAAAAPSYLVTDTGMSCALAVNRDGTVVGTAGDHAAIYRDGVLTDLGTLGGLYGRAQAINRHGRAVGTSTDADGDWHAVEVRHGALRELLPGLASAEAINDLGQIVGTSQGEELGYLYDSGVVTSLGTLGGAWSRPSGINNRGQIVGTSTLEGYSPIHAFLYEGGVMKDMGTLGGNTSWAAAINEAGEFVGHSNLVDGGPLQAYLYRDGSMQGLGRLHGSKECLAKAINRHTEVVGQCRGRIVGDRAFVWRSGRMHDLNELMDPVTGQGWTLRYANGINDSGQIAGCGWRDGDNRAFLLTPM